MIMFIRKISIFSLLILLILIGLCFLAGGYTDPFYIRFTTPKQKNLIIGTSRAAQGFQPSVFKTILDQDIFNYAFTSKHSPFGSVYHESIKRKHNKIKGGVFIIAVDPWSVSTFDNDQNDLELLRENNLCLDNTKIVDIKPNYQYLFNNLKGHYKDIVKAPQNFMYLHNDGWLEIKDIPMDSLSVTERISKKVYNYKETKLPRANMSSYRLHFLNETINYLNKYGKVFLVRLPIHKDILKIENELIDDFDNYIQTAIRNSEGYLDLTNDNQSYRYTDGNHLYKSSGKEVSILVANWIKEHDISPTTYNK